MILCGDWLVVHVKGDSERKVNTKYGSGTRAPLRSQPAITVLGYFCMKFENLGFEELLSYTRVHSY